MKRILTAIIFMFISIVAQGQNDFYTTLGAGFVIPTKNSGTTDNSSYVIYGPTTAPSGVSIFNLPNVNWQNNYDCGFNVNMAMGLKVFTQWRAEVEFLYQRFKRNVIGDFNWIEYDSVSTDTIDFRDNIPMTPSSNYVNVYSLLTNGYYDFQTNSKWKPLVGAGFGIAWIKANPTIVNGSFTTPINASATPTLQMSPMMSGTAFAMQLKAGVTYAWKQSTDIVLQYRLFTTSQFVNNISTITTNPGAGNAQRIFYVSMNQVSGILTNSLEVLVRFNWI